MIRKFSLAATLALAVSPCFAQVSIPVDAEGRISRATLEAVLSSLEVSAKNAGNITTGVLALDRLPLAVARTNATNTWSASQTFAGTINKFLAQNGALIHRMRDRLFIGSAVDNDGAYPNASRDWLSTLQEGWGHHVGYTTGSVVNVLTPDSTQARYAILGGARTGKLNGDHGVAIGISGFAVNDSAEGKAWGGYFEGIYTAGTTGEATGIEVNAVAQRTSINPSPNAQGNVRGHQVACGGEYDGITLYDCSVGVTVVCLGR